MNTRIVAVVATVLLGLTLTGCAASSGVDQTSEAAPKEMSTQTNPRLGWVFVSNVQQGNTTYEIYKKCDGDTLMYVSVDEYNGSYMQPNGPQLIASSPECVG